ncbi:aspartate kinase [Virgibacillus salinus]|uniref:Aspartokinase n=1 Tax=Virgibacillus salinus TaxID=553311 RepID=A0A1H0YXY1_9BACI|nr:aspartate kinase [Virgibacillus salinus]SDQ20107.1 aspartate kinase [Virgibacillus salinus]
MTVLVQKFGGTSLQSEESISKVISHIKYAVERQYKLVVVVSALGRQPDTYATDTLLNLVDWSVPFHNEREMDLLMSCGETIASIVLSNELQKNHINSTALTGGQAGIMTTAEFTQAEIKNVDTTRLEKELNNFDVVVVAGFQGQTTDGEITTIGRGGSDTTAAALGVALNAEKIEIFTDVNGIMTADPRIVKSARQLKRATYSDSCNLANQGAKVIHPSAVEIARVANVPLHVRSTYETKNGTLITDFGPEQSITGIAHKSALTHFKIEKKEHRDQIFKKLSDTGIQVDFSAISSTGLLFTIPKANTQTAIGLIKDLGCKPPQVIENCAKVSVVGNDLLSGPIASKIADELNEKDIQILQSADSHTTIGVLIHEMDLVRAVNLLHDTLQLSQPLESGVTN